MYRRSPTFNNYGDKGLDSDTVRSGVFERRQKLENALLDGEGLNDFADVLYSNSSDPVFALDNSIEDLQGQSVLTVAGSGEFAQVFLGKNPDVMEVFDVSQGALFYNELKLQALRHFDFADYKAFFGTENTLFDPAIYPLIRGTLSPQAKTYFDALIRPENKLLFVPGLMARQRPTKDGLYLEFMRERIRNPRAYQQLQENARACDVNFSLEDVVFQSRKDEPYDVVYLSNVPELTVNYQMIRDFIKRGSLQVLCTSDAPQRRNGRAGIVSDTGMVELEPGDSFTLDGMKARLLDFDPTAQFSAIIEVRAEDNPAVRLS